MPRNVTEHFTHVDTPFLEHCLCLICRRSGHVIGSCPLLHAAADSERPIPPFDQTSSPCTQSDALCKGCQQLITGLNNLPSYLSLVPTDSDWMYQIPPLAPAASLQLLSSCPLCRLIYQITYLPSKSFSSITDPTFHYEGEFAVVPTWTIHRLEQGLWWPGCHTGTGPYSKCISGLVMLKSRTQDAGGALDAIAMIDDGEGSNGGGPALGVKEVDPLRPDYNSIKRWLLRCDELHPLTCHPLVSEDLKKISLVNVETRQIVKYPSEGCDYVALSYVWGGVKQPNYKVGDVLPTVPETLEDAMTVTRMLGKRYLWADSLCIDQGNDTEKSIQISLMRSIYTGAWVTIFCVPGKSARSGLPRVGTLEGIVAQTSLKIGGKRWLSVMPTLSQQLKWSPWSARAWTFQEGLLSPRRLFFTNHQVYFECNAVQCCESLDDSNSPFHLASEEQRRSQLDERITRGLTLPTALGHGVFRDPFRPFSVTRVNHDPFTPPEDHKFRRYFQLLNTFTTRKLTYDTDSINAFSGIISRFEESGHYKKGFFYGIPIEEMPRSLVWTHEAPSRRRDGFPTWSWAGWEGAVRPFLFGNTIFTLFRNLGIDVPPLRIWRSGDADSLELIHHSNPVRNIQKKIKALQNRRGDGVYSASDQDAEEEDLAPEVSGSNAENDDTTHAPPKAPIFQGPFRLRWYDEWDESWMGKISNDVVFQLAKQMVAVPTVLPYPDQQELLIEGIVLRLTFSKLAEGYIWNGSTDNEDYGQPSHVKLEDEPHPLPLIHYGYNAEERINERSGTEQHFLLLSRDRRDEDLLMAALLHINWESDLVATRVGVASINVDAVHKWGRLNPEAMMFKLK